MVVASWNVNSIRARLDRVLGWLESAKPDVLCMQELKVEEKEYPFDAFTRLGYHSYVHCQKTYNGVGIVSRVPMQDVACAIADDVEDPQARVIAATLAGVRIVCCYVPNGQSVGSDKYRYKMEWMKRFRAHLDRTYRPDQHLLLCGDFNVAPEDRDVHDPRTWQNTTLFHPTAREALEHVRGFGFVDAFRMHHAEPGFYSWWDYRMLAFPRNRGLRIDHVFLTEPLAKHCTACEMDREARKGTLPSDHIPVVATLDIPLPAAEPPSPPKQGALPLA